MINSIVNLSILGLAVLVFILVFSYSTDKPEEKEGFTTAPYGATVTPQGAITGPLVYTNQITKLQPDELLKQAETGKLNDQSLMVLGAKNNSEDLNKALERQLKVHEIQDRANNGFQTVESLKEISKNIAQDANAIRGMFVRDGTASTKLVIDKYATVGVINDKYMPNRDRSKKLRAVGSVIVMPGFDFDATKSIDSAGTGICPTGGVPRMGLERHRKPTTQLQSLQTMNQNVVKGGAVNSLLEQNNIMSTTHMTDLNSADATQAITQEEATQEVNKSRLPTVSIDEEVLA